jgi:REP element-mobilizing transposase RayT
MRPKFQEKTAVLVTLRVVSEAWNLRSRRCFVAIAACFAAALGRFGLRLIHFSVLGNHLHLIVEADSNEALSRGMQGLNIRLARSLNRLMKRNGQLFDDHYHSRLLHSPTELVNAIAYVLDNHAHHYGASGVDPYSSAAQGARSLLCPPQTWLLRVGWRRAKRIPHWMEGTTAVRTAPTSST